MPKRQRTVFFVSDGTGLTAEGLGYSLMTQFEDTRFEQVRMPFVNTIEKAQACLKQINEAPRDAPCDDGCTGISG
jgi:regulator of PEP synthase PpsR (kinase-PPPase family)